MTFNFIRMLASGKRNRYKDEKFNLDLTYITERIIAMSFPASGIESTFRNHIDSVFLTFSNLFFQVVKFLNVHHKNSYKIYNLSGRKYNYLKFENKVEDYPWADHHSPPLYVLFLLCNNIYKFLKQNEENVVILHCNAGKGRTGTGIASVLMFCGFLPSARLSLQFYGYKRSSKAKGVTQPSQVRYVYYFEDVFKKKIKSPCAKVFKKLVMTTIPRLHKKGLRPYIEIYQGNHKNLVYTSKVSHSKQIKFKYRKKERDVFTMAKICPNMSLILVDDIYVRLNHNGTFSDDLICRFAFNTAFIPKENVIIFENAELDPDSIIQDKRYSPHFKIEMHFENFCEKCTSMIHYNEFCSKCKFQCQSANNGWENIYCILKHHDYPGKDKNIVGSYDEYVKMKKNQQIIKKPDDEDYFDLSSEEDDYSIKTKKTNSNPHSFKEEEGKMRSGSLTPPETPTYSLTGGGGKKRSLFQASLKKSLTKGDQAGSFLKNCVEVPSFTEYEKQKEFQDFQTYEEEKGEEERKIHKNPPNKPKTSDKKINKKEEFSYEDELTKMMFIEKDADDNFIILHKMDPSEEEKPDLESEIQMDYFTQDMKLTRIQSQIVPKKTPSSPQNKKNSSNSLTSLNKSLHHS